MAKNTGKRRNALGRGLGAILEDTSSEDFQEGKSTPSAGSVSEILISQIETNPYQPRANFDLVALEELSQSIVRQGLIQPITVRRMGHDAYQLISGERRLQAHKMAGKESIPAYIRTADDEQMLELALIENIQRENLNPVEIAIGYERMVSELKLTLEEMGERVGKKRATVNNYLRLLKLPPEIQLGLKESKLSMGHARAIINMQNTEDQLSIYKRILEQDLSVRAVEELVRSLNLPKKTDSGRTREVKSVYLKSLEKNLEGKFGNRVHLNQKNTGRGEIRVTFDSTEDLNRILEILEI